ncbi:MAG: hypothetical protein M3Q71_23635 [Chloroflexota bacterium]|nr:hypothetical protein [Chloroflexota bacterium]MDP9473615.1 hypothetical protein [Chloroflexota bacterium]
MTRTLMLCTLPLVLGALGTLLLINLAPVLGDANAGPLAAGLVFFSGLAFLLSPD